MELWLVARTPGEKAGVDLRADVPDGCTVADLGAALADRIGVPATGRGQLFLPRLGVRLDPDAPVADSGLRFGDEVLVASPQWRPATAAGPAVAEIVVVGGPRSGVRFPLGRGSHVVGRDAPADVVLDDPLLSRRHLVVTVSDAVVSVEDAGSRNGTFIDGQQVRGQRELTPATVVEAGQTLFRATMASPEPSPTVALDNGGVGFNRPPRTLAPPTERTLVAPTPPHRPEKRRLPLAASLGPLLLGVPILAISLATGNKTMALVGAVTVVLSPVIAALSFYEERHGGKRAYRSDLARFRLQLARLRTEAEDSLAEEVNERRRAAPHAADLLARAERLSPDLWERRPTDPDFLQLSVGWADQPSRTTVVLPTTGDEDLQEEAAAALAPYAVAANVPVLLSLKDAGTLGLCGDPDVVAGVAAWTVLQTAVLHSPRDVAIAAALPVGEDRWSWLEWLPHTRRPSTSLPSGQLAYGESAAARMFEELGSLVRERAQSGQHGLGGGPAVPRGAVVLVVSDQLDVPRTSVVTLLEDGPAVGVYVVWVGRDQSSVPGSAAVVVDCSTTPSSCSVRVPGAAVAVTPVVLDQVPADVTSRAGRALSPVRDVTAGGGRGQLPEAVGILGLLNLPEPDSESVRARWAVSPFGLDAPVGVSASGPFVLDMRHDGPHALVGGTTGAGKSELLQTWVASVAATHPPNRATFLLVDYKGGAAFKDVVDLPHTVGFVTDLDGHLVQRALTSLDAELRRREHVLRDHGAKDILEMEAKHPDTAPAALLLVVDEFAALAKELPEFVDGVVNIAQRGRSLGIHLILATQRPAGAINDNVRANTNLRIALRMNDAADSSDVIATKDAAFLPRSLPGRAYVRTGQSELAEIQVAYAGGQTSGPVEEDRTVRVRGRREEAVAPSSGAGSQGARGPSDLQALVSAISIAARDAGCPPQAAPWLPALPLTLPLEAVLDAASAEERRSGHGRVLLGLEDLPEQQAQRPRWFDLEADGNLLVHGTSGSGKTTLLRSLVVAAARTHSVDQLHVYVLDYASRGLGSLDGLPHVGSVITEDDTDRVRRLITRLEAEVASRKQLLAEAGVSTLTEYARSSAGQEATPPRLLVVLDGWTGFNAAFEKVEFGAWLDRVAALASAGRALGVHFVFTSERRNSVPTALASTCGARLVLRMGEEDEYASLGVDPKVARGAVLPSGRAFTVASTQLQVPLVGGAPSGEAQTVAVTAQAGTLAAATDLRAPAIGTLPAHVPLSSLPVGPRTLTATVGVDQVLLAPVTVDLLEGSLLVAGQARSGKSTALATIARGLQLTTPDVRLVLLAPRRSPLTGLDLWDAQAAGQDACDELAQSLAADLETRTGSEPPLVVVVDDATELTDSLADSSLERLSRRGPDRGVHVLIAADATLARRSFGGVVTEVRRSRHGLLLRPDVDMDGDLIGVRVPRAAPTFWVPGRAVFGAGGVEEVVQVAT